MVEELINRYIDRIKLCYFDGFVLDFIQRITTIKHLCNELFNKLTDCNDDKDLTELQCIVFDQIHDFLINDMKQFYHKNNNYLFNKFKDLCNLNVTVEQLGGDPNYSIPLLSAVVELSMLDSYKSPIEKMNCLLTTYDLVYAELKSAIISIISKNSKNDIELPIINNNDVIPLLMIVIIKSKLPYFYTNLLFIEEFYYKFNNNPNHLMVFNIFKTTKDNLEKFNENLSCKRSETMDINEFFHLSINQDGFDETLISDQEKKRIVNLITLSTSSEN